MSGSKNNKKKSNKKPNKKPNGKSNTKSDKKPKTKSSRKSPTESATLFRVGTIRVGNDGNKWKISLSANKVKRWVPYKSSRKGPEDSATKFPKGTIRIGNDGKQWKIDVNKDGVHRWMPLDKNSGPKGIKVKSSGKIVTLSDSKTSKPIVRVIKGLNADKKLDDGCTYDINFFDFESVMHKIKSKRVKKLGSLQITSNKIGAGELLYRELPAKPGKWNIYQYEFSLIAVHETADIRGQKFVNTKGGAGCDIGMFAFNDHKRIKSYSDEKKSSKRIFGTSMAPFDVKYINPYKSNKTGNKIGNHDAYYIYENNLDDYDPSKNKTPNKNPVALFTGNGYGDGFFPIFKGSNAYFIMSSALYNKIFNFVDSVIPKNTNCYEK